MTTIYNVYVPMTSQEQCDRMKQLCIDYNLPYWSIPISWVYFPNMDAIFCSYRDGVFGIMQSYPNISRYSKINTQITEQEFINLLKETEL